MKFPFVVLPRSVYDDLAADRRTMLELLATLKRDGFAGRVARDAKVTLPQATPEEVALRETEDLMIRSMADDFVRNGVPREEAEREARRIATQLSSTSPSPLN